MLLHLLSYSGVHHFVLLYVFTFFVSCCDIQGRIQDFKLGGAQFKKIAPSGGRREHFWGISLVKNHNFTQKKSYFFPILGGRVGRTPGEPPLETAPDIRYDFLIKIMFGSSVPQAVCRRAHVICLVYRTQWCPTYLTI